MVSFRFPLQNSSNNGVKFQPGQTDVFNIDDQPMLDRIKKIRLSHDARNSRWHPKHIVVELGDSGKVWKFYCNKWIDGGDLGLELSPVKRGTDEFDLIQVDEKKDLDSESEKEIKNPSGNSKEKIRYKIKIVTSEISKLEPDMKLKLRIVGREKQTGWIRVEEFPMIHIFKAEEIDVGPIDKVVIMCPNKENGQPIDWFFDQIVVAINKYKTYIFSSKARSMITLDKEKNRAIMEVYASEIRDTSKKETYTVSFYSRAQTLASNELGVKMFGEFGNSGELRAKLFKSELKSAKLFAKNTLVNFAHKFFDFGKVYKIDLTIVETRHAKIDLDSLMRSFVGLTYGRQKYNFFFIKNKSVQRDEKNDKLVKVTFYEEEYIKQRFADELLHDALFDEPRTTPRTAEKKRGNVNRRSVEIDNYSDSFDSYDNSFEREWDRRDKHSQASLRSNGNESFRQSLERSSSDRSLYRRSSTKLRYDDDWDRGWKNDRDDAFVSKGLRRDSPKYNQDFNLDYNENDKKSSKRFESRQGISIDNRKNKWWHEDF